MSDGNTVLVPGAGSTTRHRGRSRDPLTGGWKRWLLAVPVLAVMIPLLIIPLVQMVRSSFDVQSRGVKTEGIWTLENYIKFVTDPFFWNALIQTLAIGLATAFVCFLIGYPYAYFVTRRVAWRQLQIAVLIAPLLVNMVARVYGWQVLLSNSGLINGALLGLGIVKEPVQLLYTHFAVVLALVHVLLPYMVLSIYAVLGSIDRSYEDAARSLGATKLRVFLDITLPLSRPGITAGLILVFTLAAGSFLVPSVMGGGRINTLPTLTYQYAQTLDWPLASVIAIILTVVTTPIIIAYQRRSLRPQASGR